MKFPYYRDANPTSRLMRGGGVAMLAWLTACSGAVGENPETSESGSNQKTPGGVGMSPATGVDAPAAPGDAAGVAPGGSQAPSVGGGATSGSGSTSGSGTGVGEGAVETPPGAVPLIQCEPGVPQASRLQRLTHAQYDQTVRDLLGINGNPSRLLAPHSDSPMDQRAWDGYRAAAEALASEVMADAALSANIVPCDGSADGACAGQFIVEFGKRAFRRPLSEEEVERYEGLYAQRASLTANGTFEEGIQLVLEAMLQSPFFITRSEKATQAEGDRVLLDDYELASRLSYMLWGTMPDEELFDVADQGLLSTAEGIRQQAQRMLQEPKARQNVQAFHRHYAHMGPGTRWMEMNKDPALFPQFTPAQVPLMSEETERFFDHVVFGMNGSFQDLLTQPIGFVNAALAPLYGLEAGGFGSELEPVELDAEQRPGFLTRVGFLASHALYDRASPILRGAFIQEEVLCFDIPAPPPDAEGTPLPTEGLATNRERVDAQTAAPSCAGCHHNLINPTGFALESFSATGTHQSEENGVAIDTSATVPLGADLVEVQGATDLMLALAESAQAQYCYAYKWVEYAYGRSVTSADACVVNDVAGKLADSDYSILDLIVDLTQSPSFRYRALDTEVAQ